MPAIVIVMPAKSGHFSIQESAAGGLSYKEKKGNLHKADPPKRCRINFKITAACLIHPEA